MSSLLIALLFLARPSIAADTRELDAARLPWQSFATNMAAEQTGRGVCRDYAAIARDFLRAMGTRARVVGSTGHSMTEVTLSRGGRDEVFLFEPQFDLLEQDCVLYRYAR